MDSGCDWYCDECNAYMNDQPGFSTITGRWKCRECGALNDVGDNNVLDLLNMARRGIQEFITKPLKSSEDDDD